jgi:hypothetical protein
MTADDHLQGQQRPSAEQVAWVFHHLNDLHDKGGSFRLLIYQQMGFDEKPYGLLMAQGLPLSNLINCARDSEDVSKRLLECYL